MRLLLTMLCTVLCSSALAQLPLVISAPGEYALCDRDLSWSGMSGSAVTIMADDVTLDLCGKTLSNGAGSANLATGIIANGRKNLTVRNGSVEGFLVGVRLDGAREAHRVERLRIRADYIGVWIDGRHADVRDNFVAITGSHAGPTYGYPIAIRILGGEGAVVTRNVITEVVRPTWATHAVNPTAYGIFIVGNRGALVSHNVITRAVRQEPSTYAIFIQNSWPTTVVNNHVGRFHTGIRFHHSPSTETSSGSLRGNVIQDAAICFVGGVQLSDNHCVPGV